KPTVRLGGGRKEVTSFRNCYLRNIQYTEHKVRAETPHPGSMPPVNRGYVPGLSFPPRALAAARLGEGRMWKGFWPKTYGSLCLPSIYCRPLPSKISPWTIWSRSTRNPIPTGEARSGTCKFYWP